MFPEKGVLPFAVSDNRPLHDLRKIAEEEGKLQKVLFRLDFLPVDIDKISDSLENIKGNTERKKKIKTAYCDIFVKPMDNAIQVKNKEVPDKLADYQVIKVNTSALLGVDPVTGEAKIQTLIDELKEKNKLILFIDEIHTLMGSKGEALDFANMFKPALDRGDIKVIGATTSEEYERYILRDKAFVRRFQKVEVSEPTREENIEILMGTLPKIEARTGAVMAYTPFIKRKMMEFITDITSEYKRIYEIGSRYPDVSLTLVQQAFSNALFNNRTEVSVMDFKEAIANSKNIYPDVIKKALVSFDTVFADQIAEYNNIDIYEKLDEN